MLQFSKSKGSAKSFSDRKGIIKDNFKEIENRENKNIFNKRIQHVLQQKYNQPIRMANFRHILGSTTRFSHVKQIPIQTYQQPRSSIKRNTSKQQIKQSAHKPQRKSVNKQQSQLKQLYMKYLIDRKKVQKQNIINDCEKQLKFVLQQSYRENSVLKVLRMVRK